MSPSAELFGLVRDLKYATPRAKQWAEKINIGLVLDTVSIGVNPPSAAEISKVAGAEFGREAGRTDSGFQLLKFAMEWQVGEDDRIIEKSL